MKKLLSLLTFGFVIGISSSVIAGSAPTKCEINTETGSVTCSNDKDKWTCRNVQAHEWVCEGRLTSWTTDCPYCPTLESDERR